LPGVQQATTPGFAAQLPVQALSIAVFAVDHRPPVEHVRPEQPGLGLEVGLHIPVEVQVVLAQIGEHCPGKPQPRHPLLRQRMGTHLHGGPLHTVGHRLGQVSMHHVRRRRGVAGRHHRSRPAIFQGAQQGRGGPHGGAQMLDPVGGGGFAVGAGHANEL